MNRIDVLETITVSGNSGPLDTSDQGQVSLTAMVSSLTGSGAYVQVEIEASDDGINFNTVHSTKRFTANGVQRISGIRISSRYYRYSWMVGGTSPSADLQITTTIKDYSPVRTGSLFRYDNLDLKTLGAVSTTYSSFSNDQVGVVIVREDVLSDTASVIMQVSSDSVFWADVTGDILIGSNSTAHRCISGTTHRFFRLKVVTAVTNVGTSTAHALWSSTGGA